MSQRHLKVTGHEPGLSDHQPSTGMEPALSRQFKSPHGSFRLKGLEAPAVPIRHRPLVVLAECDPDAVQLSLLMADSNGYQVRLTGDGVQAWQMAQTLQPDLLVTNIQLLGMSGLELLRLVRSDPKAELCSLPVLVMDVHHRHQDVRAAFKSGADDYLGTPYDLTAMLRYWRRMLSACHRPSPLTALQNDDEMIRQVALSDLLERLPDGLTAGLSGYLLHPDLTVRSAVCWALRRVGTVEALAALERHQMML